MKSIDEHIQKDQSELEAAKATGDQAKQRHLTEELKSLEEYKEHNPEDKHDPTSLELYCDANPDADECRVYDDWSFTGVSTPQARISKMLVRKPTSIFYGFKPLISFPDPINLKNSAHLEIIAKYFSLINFLISVLGYLYDDKDFKKTLKLELFLRFELINGKTIK